MHILGRQCLFAFVAALLLGASLLGAPHAARADDDCGGEEYEHEYDHERARRAMECGEVLPLADVLAAVRPHISGKIIETEFTREDGVWVYEMKLIDRQGRFVEIHVDARTGRILKTEGEE